MEYELRIKDQVIRRTRDDVIAALWEVKPGLVRVHGVWIAGRMYPVKEALNGGFGLGHMDFHNKTAERMFSRMGSHLERRHRGPLRTDASGGACPEAGQPARGDAADGVRAAGDRDRPRMGVMGVVGGHRGGRPGRARLRGAPFLRGL
jgi:hypothetical protein